MLAARRNPLPSYASRLLPRRRRSSCNRQRVGEFAGVVGAGDDMADLATREAVDEIIAVQQSRRRDDYGAQFHRRQHAFP
jgi:hypothetical protein